MFEYILISVLYCILFSSRVFWNSTSLRKIFWMDLRTIWKMTCLSSWRSTILKQTFGKKKKEINRYIDRSLVIIFMLQTVVYIFSSSDPHHHDCHDHFCDSWWGLYLLLLSILILILMFCTIYMYFHFLCTVLSCPIMSY